MLRFTGLIHELSKVIQFLVYDIKHYIMTNLLLLFFPTTDIAQKTCCFRKRKFF
uniref:Uncharacterized protein n=1 Tax=Anguilla anguilla TaxID=7936 RepID=A0A0E9PFG1_ANGAN